MKIILSNAGKRFAREWIFKSLTTEFSSGAYYAITGANGSGKSTLMQVISSAISLNSGSINWQQNNVDFQPENVHQHISFAAPYFELIEEFTAREFLLFHFSFKKILDNFSVDEILKTVELSHAALKQIRFFSSGMKQRLKLAQAFFADTPVLLLDEPCTNLDAAGYELYYKLLEAFSNNRLVIVSSNDVNEYRFCKVQLNIQDYKQL